MTFMPYVYFDGNCEDALDFYADVFGADEVTKMRFKDAPPDVGLPASDQIMYGHVKCGSWQLMANDAMPGTPYAPQASVSIAHQTRTLEQAETVFGRVSDGGTITMPFQETFFSAGFGMCQDKFGTNWMVMVAQE